MTNNQIAELASAVGCKRAEDLSPSELVSFEVSPTGDFEVTLANGEKIRAAADEMLSPHDRIARKRCFDLLQQFAPGFRVGVPFYRRRVQIAEGRHSVIFTEGGR